MESNEQKGIAFNLTDINGELEWCDAHKLGTNFKVSNYAQEFWFLPVRISDQRFQMFCRDSQAGDRIIKRSFDTVLYLITNQLDTIKYDFVQYFPNGTKIIPDRKN